MMLCQQGSHTCTRTVADTRAIKYIQKTTVAKKTTKKQKTQTPPSPPLHLDNIYSDSKSLCFIVADDL